MLHAFGHLLSFPVVAYGYNDRPVAEESWGVALYCDAHKIGLCRVVVENAPYSMSVAPEAVDHYARMTSSTIYKP
jgi:hypothetical protein